MAEPYPRREDQMKEGRAELTLRSCEARLIASIRNDWAVQFGSREVRLIIEYQDGVPVLIRVVESSVKEEKLT